MRLEKCKPLQASAMDQTVPPIKMSKKKFEFLTASRPTSKLTRHKMSQIGFPKRKKG
jgi:hypothetical protein